MTTKQLSSPKLRRLKKAESLAWRRAEKARKLFDRAENILNKAEDALGDAEEDFQEELERMEDQVPCKCSFAKLKPHTRAQHPQPK